MCGDIMNIWNVKSVVSGLVLHTGIVNVALMSAAKKQGQSLLRNTSRQIRVNYRNRGGLKARLGRCASSVIDRAKKVSEVQLYEPSVMRKRTQRRKRSGILNTGIVGVAQMLAIWIGKQYRISLNHSEINARTVERLSELRLTTLNHYQKVAQTILITYSHYANPVTQRKATDESYL